MTNEKIKELAEQAETKEIGYYFFDREKFAELIVKECANAIREDAKRFPPSDLLWIGAMEESAYVVIKHFGVTE